MISEISKTNNLEAENLHTELWNLDGAIYEYTDHNSDLESSIEYEFDLVSDCMQMKFTHDRCFSPDLTNFSSSESTLYLRNVYFKGLAFGFLEPRTSALASNLTRKDVSSFFEHQAELYQNIFL